MKTPVLPSPAGGDMDAVSDLIVLAVDNTKAVCSSAGQRAILQLRAPHLTKLVPGEIAQVRVTRRWTYARITRLEGILETTRLDAAALDLTPLHLQPLPPWNPADEYWGEEEMPVESWARAIIAFGPRPAFEMEQVLPGADFDDLDGDPIVRSNDRHDAGDVKGARRILMDLCQADLRCLDAHSHLGNLVFDAEPALALRHYEVGVRIGELSLGPEFGGVLAWGWIDNRPFLRCLHGFGLCLWRLGRFQAAHQVFERLLWLNPADNQGVRGLIGPVAAREPWREELD